MWVRSVLVPITLVWFLWLSWPHPELRRQEEIVEPLLTQMAATTCLTLSIISTLFDQPPATFKAGLHTLGTCSVGS